MSNDAIISICLAFTLCVLMICLCVSSCYHSKYYYNSDEDNDSYKDPSKYHTSLQYTIPEDDTDEVRLNILKAVLEQFKNRSGFEFTINGEPLSNKQLEELVEYLKKEKDKCDKNNQDT